MRRSLLAVMAGDPDTTASAPAGGSGRQWPRGRLACTNDEMPLYGRLTTSSRPRFGRVVGCSWGPPVARPPLRRQRIRQESSDAATKAIQRTSTTSSPSAGHTEEDCRPGSTDRRADVTGSRVDYLKSISESASHPLNYVRPIGIFVTGRRSAPEGCSRRRQLGSVQPVAGIPQARCRTHCRSGSDAPVRSAPGSLRRTPTSGCPSTSRWPAKAGSPRPSSGSAPWSLPVVVDEDRSVESFADGQVDGRGDAWGEGHGDELAALAQHGQRAMVAFLAERFNVGTDRLGHAQPVQREQRHQLIGSWRSRRLALRSAASVDGSAAAAAAGGQAAPVVVEGKSNWISCREV